jgi:hypothetical protein
MTRVRDEEGQKLELAGGERDRLAFDECFVGGEVDLEAPVAAPARRAPVRCAAQHGLDARHDLGRRRRLDDVVVGAEGEAAQLVAVLAASAEEDQRHVGALADAPTKVETRSAGKHDIEHDAVDAVAVEGGDRRGGVARRDDHEALDVEEVGEQGDDIWLVLHEQDRRRAHLRKSRAAPLGAAPFSSDVHGWFPGPPHPAGAVRA